MSPFTLKNELVRCIAPLSPDRIARENNLLREQLRQFHAILPLTTVVTLINSMALTAFLGVFSPTPLVFIWFAIMLVGVAYIGWYAHRVNKRELAPTISGRSLKRNEGVLLLFGCVWGSAIFLAPQDQLTAAYFVFMVNVGMACGFAAITAATPRVSMRFAAPALTLSCLYFLILGDVMGLSMAMLIVVLGVALFLGGIQSQRQLQENIESWKVANRARRDLFEAIESINDAFAIHDDSGRVIMCNSTFTRWFPNGLDVEPAQDESVHRLDNSKWVMRSVVPTDDGRRVSIHNDITALKTREQQLIAARREAEDANLAKARFMATMSHELRTPLNIIIGFSSIMSSKSNIPVSLEEMRDHADSIHDAGKHLLNVIDDIIEFAQVGSDRYIHTPEAHDPRDLISRSIALSTRFLGAEERKGIELAAASTLGQIIVDEAAFRRILMSLVSNAIKFGGSPTRIHVRAYLGPAGEPMISVRDFGRGIAPADLEKIFEPFFQCEADRGGEFSGTGLGLALARQIARLHGGDVSISSRQGAGTTATIILPASAHIPPAEVAAPPALPVKNVSAA